MKASRLSSVRPMFTCRHVRGEEEAERGGFMGDNRRRRKRVSGWVLQLYQLYVLYSRIKGLHPGLLSPAQSRDTAAEKTLQTEP